MIGALVRMMQLGGNSMSWGFSVPPPFSMKFLGVVFTICLGLLGCSFLALVGTLLMLIAPFVFGAFVVAWNAIHGIVCSIC